MNNLFLNLILYKFIVKSAKWLDRMFFIVYLPLNDAQVFAENNYYMFFYFKMKLSMQSNQWKPACNFWVKLWKSISFKLNSYIFVDITNM